MGYIKGMGCQVVDWTDVAQDGVQYRGCLFELYMWRIFFGLLLHCNICHFLNRNLCLHILVPPDKVMKVFSHLTCVPQSSFTWNVMIREVWVCFLKLSVSNWTEFFKSRYHFNYTNQSADWSSLQN